MTRTRLTLTLLAAAALAGCAEKSKPQPRTVGEIAPGSFEVAWSAESGVDSPQAVYQAGDRLFVYGKKNVVSAFDLNGGLKYRVTVGEPGDIIGQPLVGPNRVVFPTSATLEVYSTGGVKTKSIPLVNPVRSPGVMVGDDIYFGSDSDTGGRLAVIDLTRTVNIYRWQAYTGIVNTKPVFFDNVLYCATEDGRVYAINPDRTPLWGPGPEMPDGLFHTDGKIIAGIKADETGVYVPSTDTKLYCLSQNTGRLRWSYYAGSTLTTSPVLTSDMVYQYVDGQGVVALNKKSEDRNASAKWSFAAGKQVLNDDAKYTYVMTSDGGLSAVNKADGSLAFRSKRSDYSHAVASPDAKNPAVFAVTKDGQLVCIKPVLRAGVVGELAMLTP